MFELLLVEAHCPSDHMLFCPLLTHPEFIQIVSWIQRSVSTFIGLTFNDDDDKSYCALSTYYAMYIFLPNLSDEPVE